MTRVVGFAVTLFLGVAVSANAQTRLDSQGRRCISEVKGRSINAGGGLFQHTVAVQNSCVSTIYVRVCYSGGRSCGVVTASPSTTTFGIIGTGRSEAFQFEYSEIN
jgi:hypothetical protein